MNTSLIEYIENSFLSSLLKIDSITDISYNGKEIFYQDNYKGRLKSEIKVSDKEVYDFIRQISNLSDSLFSFSNPIFDISCGKYRINATHYAVSRKNREKVINFSIRVGYENLWIKDDDTFITKRCLTLVDEFITHHESIIISGVAGSGKTELQKFLLSRMADNTRVVIIDNLEELDIDSLLPNIDSQTWLLNDNLNIGFDSLIKNALRINPDWIIVSEARGGEMLSLLNSAMTGHPTISTIHSKNASFDYTRMTRMCIASNQNLKYDETIEDIYDHFKLIIHVSKTYKEGRINRYVSEIGTNVGNVYYVLFAYPNDYYDLPKKLKEEIGLNDEEFAFLEKRFLND